MKYKLAIGIFLSILVLSACTIQTNDQMIEKYKAEVVQAETDFAEMAKLEGVAEAFMAFAAEDAVLLRGQKLIKGKAEIQAFFDAQASNFKDVKLMWKPDFVEVSESGDLAYTYGGFTSKVLNNDGKVSNGSGVFHTVWKRQTDGIWKFVWD